MIYTALDNFYLTKEQLEASPSCADGIDAATEAELRRYCCDVVAEAAVLLRLPQVVAATAQVLIQRFYCKRSLKKFDVKAVGMAAFWLACKLEEVIEIDSPHRLTLRSVVTVVDRVTRRREGRSLTIMDPYSQKYEELKMQATTVERHMLRAFGFVVHVEHPHRFVLNYCQMLMKPGDERQRALQQEAWNMANDSLRTTLCVRFRAEAVACGILFTAARKLQIPLPEDPAWWLLFEVREEELVEVCRTLCHLYAQPRAQNVPLVKPAGQSGAAALPAGARSPLSQQQPTPPLRSPAAGSAGAAAPRGSDGEAPSVAPGKSSGAAAGAQPEPSTGANGTASAAAGGSDKQRGREEREREGDSRSERRRRSTSRSRSRGRGGGRDSRRRSSRSRSRSRSADRGKRERRSRSRSPGAAGKDVVRRDERDNRRDDRRRDDRRRDDQALYRPGGSRPGGGRPPRRDDRRREDPRDRDYRGGSGGGHRR
ncbi:hypothetical protein ABPG75_003343 [Micractinium tetrahymenae]